MERHHADSLLEKYSYLHDTSHKGRHISIMMITPLNHEKITELAWNLSQGASNYDILRNYQQFDVVVIFDWEDFAQTGYIEKVSLYQLLDEMNINKP